MSFAKIREIEAPGKAVRIVLLLSLTAMHLLLSGLRAEPGRPEDWQYDPRNGQGINELCAGCHGENGEGGGDDEYPRLAGLSAKYMERQLLAFRSQERLSIAMAMYATERELPDEDLLDICRYLSERELLTRMPAVDPDLSAYDRLLIAKRVMNVPRYEGNVIGGKGVYDHRCRKCHGVDGRGRGSTPMLAGQYSEYIRLQIEQFRTGERKNEKMAPYLKLLTHEDIESLLAYLSVADD